MAQNDTLTLIGIGVAILFGALQMRACNCHIPALLFIGWVIIALGAYKFLKTADCSMQLIIALGTFSLLFVTYNLAIEAYHSSHVSEYITLYERNGENWDNGFGKPNESLELKEDGLPLRLAYGKQPAKFTPVVRSEHDSLDQNTVVWITVKGTSLQFHDDPSDLKEWRASWNSKENGNQYVGLVDTPIHHGKTKMGPDGIIKVSFPVGDHVIEYKIEGESRKGCSFSKMGKFTVQIYEDPKPNQSS